MWGVFGRFGSTDAAQRSSDCASAASGGAAAVSRDTSMASSTCTAMDHPAMQARTACSDSRCSTGSAQQLPSATAASEQCSERDYRGGARSSRLEPLGNYSCSDRYRKISDLSRGAMGLVQKALDLRTGQAVAIKSIARAGQYNAPTITRELLNQRLCAGHPNIIQLQEVFLTDDHLCIVMELADGGDLSSRIDSLGRSGQRGMAEADARWLFQQLLVAMDYCHRLGIANRDVKLDNMMVHGCWPRPVLKLCDFGFSKVESAQQMCESSCGTPEYMAPEVLFEEEYMGKTADVWSVGVSLYVLLTGVFPFKRAEDAKDNNVKKLQRMFVRIINGDYAPAPHLSPACQDLLRQLLNPEPRSRMTIADALRHPWVTQDLDPRMLGINSGLLMAGGAAAFCMGGAGAAMLTEGSSFPQNPVELAQLVGRGTPASAAAPEFASGELWRRNSLEVTI